MYSRNNCSSPVPVGSVIGEASLVEAPLGQGLLLVQDKLLEPHFHLSTGHGTYGAKMWKELRYTPTGKKHIYRLYSLYFKAELATTDCQDLVEGPC